MNPQFGAALGGGALIAGVLLVMTGLVGTRGPARPPNRLGVTIREILGSELSAARRRRRRIQLGAAAVVLVAGWLYSGIPVVGISATGVVLAIPWLFGAGREETRTIARLEAIEIWTRRLSDLVRSGAGLHQAIVISAQEAPAAIAVELAELAAELRGEMPTVEALRRFADRLADASSDEVIAALMLNARERGPRLGDVLDRISESMMELITMRREIASGRTDARISGQILSGLALGALLVVMVNRHYMHPYHTLLGQTVLAFCMVTFGGLLVWCRQLNRPQRIPRLLRAGASAPVSSSRPAAMEQL